MKESKLYVKGFNKDLKCRGYQFEVGGTYTLDTTPDANSLCTNKVFHFCESLSNVHSYYSCLPDENNRFCYVEALGEVIGDGEKFGSNSIKVVREIVGEELQQLLGLVNGNVGLFNTGSYNTGNGNTGGLNTGSYNTGIRNTGDGNTGTFNSCDYSNGVFCTQVPTIKIFNIDSGMTYRKFINSKYYDALCSSPFELTYWDGEKTVERSFADACAKWWEDMSTSNKNIIKSMPNFDAAIFKEITGIEV